MDLNFIASNLGIQKELVIVIVVVLAIWQLVWKGLALWRAAQNKSKWWFIIMLITNDLGIIEILYLFIFSKRGKKKLENKENYNEA